MYVEVLKQQVAEKLKSKLVIGKRVLSPRESEETVQEEKVHNWERESKKAPKKAREEKKRRKQSWLWRDEKRKIDDQAQLTCV